MNRDIIYAPEQEGGSSSHNPELSSEKLGEKPAEDLDSILEGIEMSTEEQPVPDTEPILEDALDSAEQAIQSPDLPFPISEKSGLSYQGETIHELKEQLQALESREDKRIEEETIEARKEAYTQVEQALTLAQTDLDDTIRKISARLNKLKADNPKITLTTEDFINSTPALKSIVDTKEEALKVSEQNSAEFKAETQRLIEEAYKSAIKEIEERLKPLQHEYTGSEAEVHDKRVLLDQKLESLLTSPEELFSDTHIAEILAVYGLQEGKERIQQLQEQSKEAQEQQKKDDIKEEILQNIYWSKDEIPELTQAINTDIEAKLNQLQEQYPDLEPITIALKLSGKDRFAYLLDSEEPKLEQLAFWSTMYKSGNWDTILAEHPQLRQYVENQVNRTFADREQAKEDFHLQREKKSQELITATIENQVSRYKKQEVNRIQGEISQIQNDETFYTQDRRDKSIVQSKEAIRLNDINEFKTSIQSGVEGITINEGRFITQNDIAESNKKIDEEMVVLLTKIQGYITGMGYKQDKVSSLDDLNTFGEQITNDLTTESKKLFKDKAKITQLTALQKHIEEVKEHHQTLNNQKIENQEIFRQRLERVRELNTIVGRLPQYIKETLMASPMNTMSERLEALVQELQQYETPAALTATRERIALLQKQIEELQRVT